MTVIIITIFLFVLYGGLILYYRQSWGQIPDFACQPGGLSNGPFISVIIPARNEENNIRVCLDSIARQTYPAHLFEIIVVDDFSTDDTAAVVRNFSAHPVRLVSLQDILGDEKLNSYKKKAIDTAISLANGGLVVTTDADCIVPESWLETISGFYHAKQPVFIAAPVVYHKEKNFLEIFQSLDFMTLQGITGAAVHKKFHNMCNGANLAYEKKVFFEVGGFKGIDNIASGDDMLLMHKIFERHPQHVLFLKSREAIVKTRPAETLKDFFNQRIRWASKADKYTDKKITGVLLLVYFFNVWIVLLGIIALLFPYLWMWFAGLLVCKTAVELFFLYPVAGFFNKRKLLWWFPAAQPFHILYTIIAGWLGKFGTYQWKERKVK